MVVDLIVLGIILVMTCLGFRAGFVKTLGGFIKRRAFIFAVIISFYFSGMFVSFFPDRFWSFMPRPIMMLIMTAVITLLFVILLKILGRIVKRVADTDHKPLASRIGGAAFMLAEYVILTLIVLGFIRIMADFKYFGDAASFIENDTVLLKLIYESNPLILFLKKQ